MIKLTDILDEIKTDINEISDVKYAYYMLKYDNNEKTYMTSGYLKVLSFISSNNITDYELYGRKFNPKNRSNEWEFIEKN
jgi:hypothetical protein